MVKLIRTSPCAVMKLLHMAVHDCLLTRFKYRLVSEIYKKILFSNSFKARMCMLKLHTSAMEIFHLYEEFCLVQQ